MSNFSAYHSLGQAPGAPGYDPQDPRFQTQYAQQQFPPSQAPQPGYTHDGYQQGQQQFAQTIASGEQDHYAGQIEGYTGGLTSQMAGLGLSGDSGARPHKKKQHRHAYHDLGPAPTPAQAFNGTPQAPNMGAGQFLNNAQQPSASPSLGFQGQPSPSLSQPSGLMDPTSQLRSGEGSVATAGRVDPEQIPSIPRARDAATQFYQTHVYPTMEQHLPPPAAIPFVAHDQGNSAPKFARLTLNHIPATSEALSSTGLPLGLILQPLATLEEGEQPIPVLDFGDAGPPRCRRCRTYINPFMTFRSGGNKLVCNMCSFPNDVAPEYFAPTDLSGIRVDRLQRPELMMGTVEFVVPKEYWAKEPVGLRWLFLVDVSQEAVNRNFIATVCEGIRTALYGDQQESEGDETGQSETKRLPEGSRIGIVTFDKEVHFYSLNASLDKAQMMVMTDLEDPFVPISDGLFVDPQESKDVIMSLLEQLPTMFTTVKNPEPALLPTINAALSALSATGGKIVCAISALPTWGPGRLFLRDTGKGTDTNHEKKLYTTEHPGWKKAASDLVKAGVGIDYFIAAAGGGYMDIATIGHTSAVSGGQVFYYPNFHAPRDALKLASEITHVVNRETGYQGLMKVRCSNGLQVSSYHGSFLQHTFGADLEFGTIDADKAIGVIFSYDGKLDPKLDAHFQSALLYTTAAGQRRVRCHNIVAGVSEGTLESMKFIDQDAVVGIVSKQAASRLGEKSLKDIRAGITEKTIDIMAGYRRNYSGSTPHSQLVLPEFLKEFPMYTLSLIKSRAFKGGNETSDRRVHAAHFLSSASLTEISLYLYPRIYAIHNLSTGDCFPSQETGQLLLPPTMRASYGYVEEGGVYIVDDGQIIVLWLHAQVSPNLLEDLFGEGVQSLQAVNPWTSSLPVLETHLNAQVRNLMQYLSTVRGSRSVHFQIARQGLDGSEFEFARMLVEDRNNEAQSYVDWLVHVHRHIQLELAGHRKKDESGDGSNEGILSNLTGLKAPYWS